MGSAHAAQKAHTLTSTRDAYCLLIRSSASAVALSDIYSRLRLLKEPGAGAEAEGGVWVPPESFERETTKVRTNAVRRYLRL